jgi:O-acetyl-ADP-ribose deacetylase (regulator of RNase III)
MHEYLDGRLIVETGDITAVDADAVVNAANSSLMGGGGVDGAIHRRGGSQILQECKEIRNHQYPDGLPAGKAVITGGGKLPANHVIHTVGPVWHGGNQGEDETLANAYANSLSLAAESGLKSVAFPAISTGVYGFPKQRAAVIAFKTIKQFLSQNNMPRTVRLVFFSDGDTNAFVEALREQDIQ